MAVEHKSMGDSYMGEVTVVLHRRVCMEEQYPSVSSWDSGRLSVCMYVQHTLRRSLLSHQCSHDNCQKWRTIAGCAQSPLSHPRSFHLSGHC